MISAETEAIGKVLEEQALKDSAHGSLIWESKSKLHL